MPSFTFPGAPDVAVELLPVADRLEALFPEERALVDRATSKRQREFASGRVAAHAVMRHRQLSPVAVLRRDRAPQWPPGFVGSIAHSRHWAMATLMPNEEVSGIGLDLESHDRMKASLLHMVLTQHEQSVMTAASGTIDLQAALAVFSAKESVYKALNPLVDVFIGLREVEVEISGAGFRVRYVGGKGLELMERGEGHIAWHADFVATLFVLR